MSVYVTCDDGVREGCQLSEEVSYGQVLILVIGVVGIPWWDVYVCYVYVSGLCDVKFDQLLFNVVWCLYVDLCFREGDAIVDVCDESASLCVAAVFPDGCVVGYVGGLGVWSKFGLLDSNDVSIVCFGYCCEFWEQD